MDGIYGTEEDDEIFGGPDPEGYFGMAGDDLIVAGPGQDILVGDTGEDVLIGGEGDDSLGGSEDDDVLFGNIGNDMLDGGGGADKLKGGAGDDWLFGGWDKDTMKGGGGEDHFVFFFASESSADPASADIIKGFERDVDKIDLSGMLPNYDFEEWYYIGRGKFSGEAGDIRFKDGVVEADTNGDETADFVINLPGVGRLHESDFIL